jgi:FkbM family methyltransferase
MFANLIRQSAVRLFGLATTLGVDRLPAFDRLFLAFYAGYKRHFEAGPVERLREFVPDGSIAIDVGANVGFFARRFASWVGTGEVIAIEPEERNYQILLSTLKSEGLLTRVRPLRAVAAATAGTMSLEINRLHPADHKLTLDGTGVPVAAVRLDDLIQDKGALRPSLVKIDVQGAEMLVLQGASEILRQSGPALFIELSEDGLNKFGSSVTAILDHLAQHGYTAHWLMRRGPHQQATPEEIHARVARQGYVDALFLRSPDASVQAR